jgi:hypothetical protein
MCTTLPLRGGLSVALSLAVTLLWVRSYSGGNARADVQSARVLGFEPSRNGLHFDNSFPKEPDYSLSILGKSVKLGNAANELCGGFVFTVKDFYEAKLLPPTNTNADKPPAGSPLLNYLVARAGADASASDRQGPRT